MIRAKVDGGPIMPGFGLRGRFPGLANAARPRGTLLKAIPLRVGWSSRFSAAFKGSGIRTRTSAY